MSENARPFAADDYVRLAALADHDILDTPAEQEFDDLTLLASQICDTPVALVSLIDRDRQWFKARIGFPPCETDLKSSVCKFVLAEPDVMVIPDLTLDSRTHANPLVTGEPFIRFYAGAPLRTPEGVAIGGLCVIDDSPRPTGLSESQEEALRALARHVTSLLELRRRDFAKIQAANTALRASEARFRNMNEELEHQVAARVNELSHAEEALRQSQKMEAVGQLTGGLAHDFNNLLAGISGSLELMQTRLQQGRFKDVERYMAAAQGASKRAAALTHRLLAFSRRQTLDPKPTNVNRLVLGMQEMIQRTVGPAIQIEVVGVTNVWPALVDPSQLENALLNLCINSRDAMPDGDRITVETSNKWMDEQAARQHDMPEGQYLALCVTDTSTGMSPEVIARVFEPFFTTKPLGEGTGLGLSMIYGFAQQSGGQVRIYSEVGQGTTVCIYLPRHSGEIEDDDVIQRPAAFPRSDQGETVLIVDDEPTVRMLVTDILDDLGYTSIEASDSSAGLKVLQSDVRIDLLVTDVGLPGGMNGRQMADAARVTRPDLKVLFITGYAENAIVGSGKLARGMAVLTKPFAVETMAARIRSFIESGNEQTRRSKSYDCE